MQMPTSKICGESSHTGFAGLPHWHQDDHSAAFAAFVCSAREMLARPYRHVSSDFDQDALRRCCERAETQPDLSRDQARAFFEENFCLVDLEGPGFVTGYFEPLMEASPVQTKDFCVPLYCRPPELVDIDDSNRPSDMDQDCRFGQIKDNRLVEYFDRGAIQAGALAGRNLELVWLKDKTDAYFIHIQGSAKLVFPDQTIVRISFSAKSGHAYSSLAKHLSAKQGTDEQLMTADRLADWMRSNPDEIDAFMAHNRSYIFFRIIENISESDGPVGAARIPLIKGRSLAVDRLLHTFGVPIWVRTKEPLPDQESPIHRLMIAHDTGSAIVGPSRGDIFLGTGPEAGFMAGQVRHDAQMTLLVPR